MPLFTWCCRSDDLICQNATLVDYLVILVMNDVLVMISLKRISPINNF